MIGGKVSKKLGWALITIGVVILTLSVIGGIIAIWLTGNDPRRLAGSVAITGFVGFTVFMFGIANEPWK